MLATSGQSPPIPCTNVCGQSDVNVDGRVRIYDSGVVVLVSGLFVNRCEVAGWLPNVRDSNPLCNIPVRLVNGTFNLTVLCRVGLRVLMTARHKVLGFPPVVVSGPVLSLKVRQLDVDPIRAIPVVSPGRFIFRMILLASAFLCTLSNSLWL